MLIRTIIIISSAIFFFRDLESQQIIMNCDVLNEIENDKSARLKLFEDKQIKLFLDLKEHWLNDLQKHEWFFAEDNISNRVKYELIDHNKKIIFKYFQYFTEKKKELELHSLIKFNKSNGYFTFVKFYYNQDNKVYFKSEINGSCKKN